MMPVVRDYEADCLKMDRYNPVEFYEILARVVDAKSRGTSEESLLLHTKLERVLD